MFGCTNCQAGTERCPRCGVRLCGEHLPFAREACAECELAYHDETETLKMNAWFLLGFALPWLVFAAAYDSLPSWSARSGGARAITTGVPMLDIIIMFVVMGVFAGKGVMGLRRWLHRRAFMKRSTSLAPPSY